MAKRDLAKLHADTERQLPAFASLKAAATEFRRYRDRLEKALATSAKRDGLKPGYSCEELDRLQEWSREVVRKGLTKSVGFMPGMLADALELHAAKASVLETGALWMASHADTDDHKYAFLLEMGNGTYPACGMRRPDDQTFWSPRHWNPTLLREQVDAMKQHAALLHFERVKPHRLRLSRRKEVRLSEIRLLERGFDPWSEMSIIAAWKHESKSKFPVHPVALATDLSRCGDATRQFLQREIAMVKEFNFEACVQALRAHVSFVPKPEPEDSMVIPD